MRKIEKEVIGAFIKGETKSMANTESVFNPVTRNMDLLLHGNRIATMSNRDGVRKLWVSCGGYEKDGFIVPSRTTQSRLNALFRLVRDRWPEDHVTARVYIKGGVQYLDVDHWREGGISTTINLMALRKSAVLVSDVGLGKNTNLPVTDR